MSAIFSNKFPAKKDSVHFGLIIVLTSENKQIFASEVIDQSELI
jgi:hypothetical protein